MGFLYTTIAVSGLRFHLDDCIKLFISKTNEIIGIKASAPVDLAAWLHYYAFDSLGAVNFSQMLGFMESGTDVDGIYHLEHDQMMYFAVRGQITAIERLWAKVKALATGASKENPLFIFALEQVQKREVNPTESADMLNLFLDLHKSVPEKFTIRDVIAADYINVLTPHDVVAITLRAVVYYFAKNPVMQEKLQQEIDDVEIAGKLSSPAKLTGNTPLSYVYASTSSIPLLSPLLP
ncbi:hypothetical protein QQS21_005638 [Conoideocrella luteorostrata]|uniref:Cytochrome P450 n=1 Tax=Conoideocrella luteorostrata TaxID=1105319 RepID=A0AAJ0FYT6_9HYPO|nr:hypothetical protein QQS21_005638 [Conoideocrella luteorostrata]